MTSSSNGTKDVEVGNETTSDLKVVATDGQEDGTHKSHSDSVEDHHHIVAYATPKTTTISKKWMWIGFIVAGAIIVGLGAGLGVALSDDTPTVAPTIPSSSQQQQQQEQASQDSISSPVATCTDGIQNQDEAGVDCGGSCPTACPTTTAPEPIPSQTYDVLVTSYMKFRYTTITDVYTAATATVEDEYAIPYEALGVQVGERTVTDMGDHYVFSVTLDSVSSSLVKVTAVYTWEGDDEFVGEEECSYSRPITLPIINGIAQTEEPVAAKTCVTDPQATFPIHWTFSLDVTVLPST